MRSTSLRLAERIRTACIKAALGAYEEGGVLGLCAQGRWEYAISTLQPLDLQGLIQDRAARQIDEQQIP